MKNNSLMLVIMVSLLLIGCGSEPSKSSINKEDASWQKFQAQKADKSLDEELEGHRERKQYEQE